MRREQGDQEQRILPKTDRIGEVWGIVVKVILTTYVILGSLDKEEGGNQFEDVEIHEIK